MRKTLFFYVIFGLLITQVFAQKSSVPSGFVLIKGGTFMMGSPDNEPERTDNETQHKVTVSSFNMGKYQVTQKEYEEVMGSNPSRVKGPNLPVVNVSWYDAIEFCNRRSMRESLEPVYRIDKSKSDPNNPNPNDNVKWIVMVNRNASGYRLPTEAEWEYACRAGTTTPFSTGKNITTAQANYNGDYPYNNNKKGTFLKKTVDVGSYKPNKWGLYDMHGNVWEWCWDWFEYYSTDDLTNPMGGDYGVQRVTRGGSGADAGRFLRSACRGGNYPSENFDTLGIRLVRNAQ